ncbi:MAG: very short patch repair endonuclease [Firmicutes bacterium]|nr:very short patch repair endonuclease [Bacillota bacterium]
MSWDICLGVAERLRFRKHRRLPVGFLARADAALPRERVAVFLDGCFWHGCSEHGRAPKAHAGFWAAKIQRNRERDRRVDAALAEGGWVAVRIWEHEDLAAAAERVAAVVRRRRQGRGA